MVWWVAALWWLGTAALSYVLRPKPTSSKQSAPKPAGINDFSFPTASASRPIPKVFGSRWAKSPNVVWYGDLKVSPIRKSSCSGGKK